MVTGGVAYPVQGCTTYGSYRLYYLKCTVLFVIIAEEFAPSDSQAASV